MLVQDSDVVLESYAPGLLPASMASLRPDGKARTVRGLP